MKPSAIEKVLLKNEVEGNSQDTKSLPLNLISPNLDADTDPLLGQFIETHFEALTPYLNWFTAELFYHLGVNPGLSFLDAHASKRISTQRILRDFANTPRFASVVINNAGQAGYVEVQSKSGFIESLRRFIAAKALSTGASVTDVAHQCGASLRTIQRLQRGKA